MISLSFLVSRIRENLRGVFQIEVCIKAVVITLPRAAVIPVLCWNIRSKLAPRDVGRNHVGLSIGLLTIRQLASPE